MKRAIILLNGEPYRGEIRADSAGSDDVRVYCCDGAYAWAKDKIKIDENLGDYDSLDYLPEPPPAEIYPSEKDYTDGELALMRAIGAGYGDIEIYGGGGKRDDHFIGNLHLLYQAKRAGVRAVLITNYCRIFAASGLVGLGGVVGKTVSIVPFGGDAHIMESRGFRYPLPETFKYGSTLGISNVITAENAQFRTEGTVLVFINCEA